MSDPQALESERDFLLRSLDDLEAERDAGNIDEETYQTLHDDYTARAASAIRSLRDDEVPAEPVGSRRVPPSSAMSRRMKVFTVVGVAAFAAFAAWGLSRALGTRDAGQTITGNAAANESSVDTLKQAAAEHPDSYEAHIAYARALLGNDLAEALKQFDAASRIDATQPEPFTYAGWIEALAAARLDEGSDRDALAQRALASLDHALTLDPEYYDAYVYRALTQMNVLHDPSAAVPDFQRFLALAPADHPQRKLVTGALAEAVGSSSTTTLGSP
jgi:cytochrome c-type biogenesis protein CcmH/NrfG